MAKYFGAIGYSITEETSPGVYTPKITERLYKGDVLRNTRRWENGTSQNDNLTINNSISVIADAFAYENIFAMKYVSWMGSRWKITNVEIQRPRLTLTIGGLYNGNEA